jgi:hypothetical protein
MSLHSGTANSRSNPPLQSTSTGDLGHTPPRRLATQAYSGAGSSLARVYTTPAQAPAQHSARILHTGANILLA